MSRFLKNYPNTLDSDRHHKKFNFSENFNSPAW